MSSPLNSAGVEQKVPVNVIVTSVVDPKDSSKFIYDLTNMKAEISNPEQLALITKNEQSTAGGSSSHSSRGGKSRRNKKSKGGKSKKARKSLRRK